MFDRFKTVKRFRDDAAKVVIVKIDFDNVKIEGKGRHVRSALRFAACTAVAIAVVLTGTVWLPGQRSQPVSVGGKSAEISAKSSAVQKVPHDFTLQVYAAETSSGGTSSASASNMKKSVTLKDNLVVPVPNGKLKYDARSGQENGKWVGSSGMTETGFICTGDNLDSVNYTAENGKLHYFSSELINEERDAYNNSIVCTIKVPKSKLKSGERFADFKKLWNSGELDEYRSKYFNGGDIDLSRYSVSIGIDSASNWNTEGHGQTGGIEIGAGPTEKVDPDTDLVIIEDSEKYNFDNNLFMFRKTITAKASDHNASVDWDPSDTAWDGIHAADKIYESTGSIDYSTVPGDTITVTGTFSDGQTVTKQIELSFDKSGILCAKLTDK